MRPQLFFLRRSFVVLLLATLGVLALIPMRDSSVSAASVSRIPGESSSSTLLVQGTQPASMTLAISPSPSFIGQPVSFTATVTDLLGGNGTPTGTVEFFNQGVSLGSSALIGNSASIVATFTAQGFSFPSASYSGDTIFSGTFFSVLHEVQPIPTMTTVVSNVNPSVVGQSVTYTAAVTSTGGVPGGSVFFSTAFVSYLAPLDSNGVAIYTTSYTSAFSDTVTATYPGDATFASSTSAPISQSITPAFTSITLTSSPNPANAGETVLFTASVTATLPGSGTPWGAVSFSLDGNFLGESFLAFGVATIGPIELTPGQHTIAATLRENSDFHSSTTTLTQVVNPRPSTVQEDIQHLIDTLNRMNIDHGTKNALNAKLQAALDAVNRGNTNAASNQLGAFIHQVEAQRGKKITDADANTLISLANAVIARFGA